MNSNMLAPQLKIQEKIYQEATMKVLSSLMNPNFLQDRKKDRIDEYLKKLADEFVKFMNQEKSVGDIVIIKSQKYIDYLYNKFIPENYGLIIEVSQFFLETLEYSGFIARSDSVRLFDEVIRRRNRRLALELSEKRPEINKFSNFENSDLLDEYFEEIIQAERVKVQDNNILVEQAWKKLQELFNMIDFPGMQIPKVYLVRYGSSQTKFQTASSDVDMTLLTNCFVDERNLLRAIRDYFDEFKKRKYFEGEIRLVDKLEVRIPNLEINFQNIQFDLTINNIFGVVNTQLLDVYSLIDDRCRKLGILVKIWAKANEICSGNNFLSSYGYLLLTINFLQVLADPVVPSIQQLADDSKKINIRRAMENQIEDRQSVEIAFEKNIDKIKGSFAYRSNKCSISALFLSFINWLQDLSEEKNAMISVKNACLLPRKEKLDFMPDDSMRNPKNFVFSIEDPFDQVHDVGRNFRVGAKNDFDDKKSKERYDKFQNVVHNTLRKLVYYCENGGIPADFKNIFVKQENQDKQEKPAKRNNLFFDNQKF